MVNNDAVVRTNYYKYFHPKECLIQVNPDWWIPAYVTAVIISDLFQNGVLNRAVSEAAGKTVPGLSLDEGKEQGTRSITSIIKLLRPLCAGVDAQSLSFLYPHGATLNVARPATAVLSTGSVSFPQVNSYYDQLN